MDGGNVSKIVLWVADTAIVQKQLSGKKLYFVADAVSGKPIPETNVEFFGWQQRHLGGNRYQVVTTNFAELTGPDGLLTPDPKDLKNEFQWLITARGKAGRGWRSSASPASGPGSITTRNTTRSRSSR